MRLTFDKCKNISEVVMMSKRMKEAGYPPEEVNRLASAKRRELVTQDVGVINTLEKFSVQASAIPKDKLSHLQLDMPNRTFTAPYIKIDSQSRVTM